MTEHRTPRQSPPGERTPAPSGAIGRRAFVLTAAALGGSAVFGRPTVRHVAAQEPVSGGVYRLVTNEQVTTLDPALAFQYIDWWLSYMALYNRLYATDADGQLVPDLADGLPEVSPDRLTYTIKIKSGIPFHNGREMTAEDVKFSLDRSVLPAAGLQGQGAQGANFLSNVVGVAEAMAETGATPDPTASVAGIELVDSSTIRITLQQPQAVFAQILSSSLFGIVPKAEVEAAGVDWGTNVLIGTGPFKFVEWSPGERIVFERNPDYFHPGQPYLDRVEVTLNVEPTAQVLRWEGGEADMVTGAPAAELARIRADPTLSRRLREAPSLIFFYLTFANNTPPYDDIRVRQAIVHAIDRDNVAQRTQTSVRADGFLTPGMPQYDPDFAVAYPYDPEQAKQLLAESGVPEGTKTSLWGGAPREILEVIQADLRAVGLDAEILSMEGSTFDVFQDRLASGEIPLATWGYGPDYLDGAEFLELRAGCPAVPQPANWCDPRVTELQDQADQMDVGDSERTAILRELQQYIINETVQMVPLYQRNAVILSQDYVHGDEPDPLITLPILENVWLDSQ